MTAYAVKEMCNKKATISIYEHYLKEYDAQFLDDFKRWSKIATQRVTFDHISINERFITLNKPYNPDCDKEVIDYNFLVDDILQISPPYQTEALIREEEAAEQQKKKRGRGRPPASVVQPKQPSNNSNAPNVFLQ